MKFFNYLSILLLACLVSLTGCKKKIFSANTLSGQIISSWSLLPVENCSVVLFKKRGSALAKNGIIERDKEICRETTDSNGDFSMKLKWLDSRDSYYIQVYYNNTLQPISSGNSRFASYKALDSYVQFKVDM